MTNKKVKIKIDGMLVNSAEEHIGKTQLGVDSPKLDNKT